MRIERALTRMGARSVPRAHLCERGDRHHDRVPDGLVLVLVHTQKRGVHRHFHPAQGASAVTGYC